LLLWVVRERQASFRAVVFHSYKPIAMKRQARLDDRKDRHECISWHENDWVVFQCPTCGFSRKLNYRNGKMVTLQRGDQNVLHSGIHAPGEQSLLDTLNGN
jgi:hypothetical protein